MRYEKKKHTAITLTIYFNDLNNIKIHIESHRMFFFIMNLYYRFLRCP